jgi:hypothetical protein
MSGYAIHLEPAGAMWWYALYEHSRPGIAILVGLAESEHTAMEKCARFAGELEADRSMLEREA